MNGVIHPFDPRLLSIQPFVPHAYADLIRQKVFPQERTASEEQYRRIVDAFHAVSDVRADRIIYRVDGLAVTGVMAVPVALTPRTHPLLIFNRGGNGEFGKLTVGQVLRYLLFFARKGFLVFASNYRGNDGSEGKDEFGGADLHDVLELLDIARSHPAWDGENAFMFGTSRGAMMTCLAIRHGAKLRAAAIMGGPSELGKSAEERAEMAQVFAERIPDFAQSPQKAYEARSAVRWADELHVPLLLLHGDADERVAVEHTIALDAALHKAGKNPKTILYPGDDHFLSRHGKEALDEIRRWFADHRVN